MIANLGEDAADAIGADGRLVRVGAYFHDLGKSLPPTYFVENLSDAEKADIMAAHPEGQRRFYRFRGGAYSNCNLFWITGEHSFRGIHSFRYGGQFAKRKKDAVRALGLMSLILYLSRLASLEGMFRHFSRRFGIRVVPLVARDGRLAIDVDNERTHRVAEEILARG